MCSGIVIRKREEATRSFLPTNNQYRMEYWTILSNAFLKILLAEGTRNLEPRRPKLYPDCFFLWLANQRSIPSSTVQGPCVN